LLEAHPEAGILYFSPTTVKRGTIIAWDFFKSYVQPRLGARQNLLAIASPEAGAEDQGKKKKGGPAD
jgi:hypothetical protein